MRGTLIIVVFTATYIAANAQQPKETCDFGKVDGLLDAAVDLFQKAKKILMNGNALTNKLPCQSFTNCWNDTHSLQSHLPQDCSDLLSNGTKTSGVYRIRPEHRLFYGTDGFNVYCDMETDGGGWTVIQKRGNYGRPEDYFFKNWETYKKGFGDITDDFWLGNDKIHALTSQRVYSIRFDLKDWEGESRTAVYKEFWISDENLNYTLHVMGYNGTAGDSFIAQHNKMMFTTFDRDNDINGGNCAELSKGAWWYRSCHHSNLNGLYLKGKHSQTSKSVSWYSWKRNDYSLLESAMKIRPANFTLNNIVPM